MSYKFNMYSYTLLQTKNLMEQFGYTYLKLYNLNIDLLKTVNSVLIVNATALDQK